MAWERVIEGSGNQPTLHRVAVPGGWLYAGYNSLLFVPEPYKVTVRDGENEDYLRGWWDHVRSSESDGDTDSPHKAWEEGHKAGYMQALANHEGDKVTPTDEPEHDDFGFENKPDVDEDSPAHARGWTKGFEDGRAFERDNLGFIARKKPSGGDPTAPAPIELKDLLTDAANALQGADYSHEHELVVALYNAANRLGNEPKATPITWDAALYGEIEALLPEDGVIDDSCSLVNEIISLIQKREIG